MFTCTDGILKLELAAVSRKLFEVPSGEVELPGVGRMLQQLLHRQRQAGTVLEAGRGRHCDATAHVEHFKKASSLLQTHFSKNNNEMPKSLKCSFAETLLLESKLLHDFLQKKTVSGFFDLPSFC